MKFSRCMNNSYCIELDEKEMVLLVKVEDDLGWTLEDFFNITFITIKRTLDSNILQRKKNGT